MLFDNTSKDTSSAKISTSALAKSWTIKGKKVGAIASSIIMVSNELQTDGLDILALATISLAFAKSAELST